VVAMCVVSVVVMVVATSSRTSTGRTDRNRRAAQVAEIESCVTVGRQAMQGGSAGFLASCVAFVVAAERSADVFRLQRSRCALRSTAETIVMSRVLSRSPFIRGIQRRPRIIEGASFLACIVTLAGPFVIGLLFCSLGEMGKHQCNRFLKTEKPSVHLCLILETQMELVCIRRDLNGTVRVLQQKCHRADCCK